MKQSFSRIMLANMLLMVTVATVLVGCLWVAQEMLRFRSETTSIREQLVSERKRHLKERVDEAALYVSFLQSRTEERTRTIIRERASEAHRLASHLYRLNRGTMGDDDLQTLIREVLRPIRYNDGRGYFFATRLDGVEQLCATCEELENHNLMDLRDAHGSYVIRDMVSLVAKEKEGYYRYFWSRPGADGEQEKLSYIKLFKPFNWLIGTGVYLEDAQKDLQAEALEWIRTNRSENGEYLFAGRWDGTSLAGPAVGQNMYEVTDKNGLKIVQEMIRKARSGDGYVSYVMPSFGGTPSVPKISYVRGLADWQWYIGTGMSVADIDRAVAEHQEQAVSKLEYTISAIAGALLLLWSLVLGLATVTSRKSRETLATFADKFARSMHHRTELREEEVISEEFQELIGAANQVVSEWRQAEERLRTTNELLAAFIRNSPIYAFIKEVTDTDSRTLWASENYRDMIGISGSEMAGKTMAELFPAEFADKIVADDLQAVNSGEILHLDEELNGRRYTTIKFPIELGGKRYLAGYTIDVTEQLLAEEALRQSEETFRNIVEASPMGIHLYEVQYGDRLVFIGGNQAADRLLRSDHNTLIGKTIEDAFPLLSGGDIPMHCRRAALSGERWYSEQVGYEDMQIQGTFEVFAFQMSPGRVAVLFNDTTERRRAEQERERLQEELTRAQKMESVGRLAGGVAHDFNNMLGVIIGHTDLAMRNLPDTNPLMEQLRHIRSAAERSAELTRQLLAFARRQPIAPKILDLNEAIEGILDLLRRLSGEAVELNWRPDHRSCVVRMDPSQIDQILVNLCANARDAIADTGMITIETRRTVIPEHVSAEYSDIAPGVYVLLTVSDDGSGIDPGAMEHLFEPFFTTKKTGHGTGLGLATVYGIVKQNNGFINVVSEPGHGSSFMIHLPAQEEQPRHTGNEVEHGVEARHSGTILLVEDEPMILEITSQMLRYLGYTVLPAATPDKAITIADTFAGTIDLLMTDVVMPDLNGRDLAVQIVSNSPNLKTLFMSGYTADVIALNGLLEEGVNFIQKPFSLEELGCAMHTVFGTAQERISDKREPAL